MNSDMMNATKLKDVVWLEYNVPCNSDKYIMKKKIMISLNTDRDHVFTHLLILRKIIEVNEGICMKFRKKKDKTRTYEIITLEEYPADKIMEIFEHVNAKYTVIVSNLSDLINDLRDLDLKFIYDISDVI